MDRIDDTDIGLRNSIEAFGCGFFWRGKKKYLFGTLPMADVFIAWSNAVEPNRNAGLRADRNWRWRFQLIFLILVFVIGLKKQFIKN